MFISHIQSFIAQFDLSPDLVEVPQNRSMGDFAIPCFSLAKEWKKSPQVIASDLADKMNTGLAQESVIERIEAAGPYLNVFLKTQVLAKEVLTRIQEEGEKYGSQSASGERVVIESPGPNTNKPLHLGHVRNMLLGNSLSHIAEKAGYEVVKVDIVNDRGIHICKSMLAYQLWGNEEEPTKKTDHYVGDWYVRYDAEFKKQIKALKDLVYRRDFVFFDENQELQIVGILDKLANLSERKKYIIDNEIDFTLISINFNFDVVLEGATDGNYDFRFLRKKLLSRIDHKDDDFDSNVAFVLDVLAPVIRIEEMILECDSSLEELLKKTSRLNATIQEMLIKWENGDQQTRDLREKMRKRALEGMHETYARYACKIDKAYYESDHYLKGKGIVQDGLATGLFTKKENGSTVFEDEKLGEKIVLRSDGTSIYITQDIALGMLRYQDWKMSKMVYIVGNEQMDHFKFLFKIFERLDYPFGADCHHLSYGMIELPDGKMKSREGNVVDADTLIDDVTQECVDLLKERYPDEDESIRLQRAGKIAMGAIKFFILKYDAKKDFVFNKEESLRFDGESGPYVQYTAVRCQSILSKGIDIVGDVSYDLFVSTEEKMLLLHISEYEQTILSATEKYQPYLIARYVLDLAQLFNSYYQKTKILDEDENIAVSRLLLVRGVRQVLENGCRLLGIEIPEKM